MTTLVTNGKNFPVINGLAAVIITFMLLMLCTQLAKFTPPPPTDKYEPTIIKYVPPPDLPEPIDEEAVTPKPINPTNITPQVRDFTDLIMPDLKNGINTKGNFPITVVKPKELLTAPPKPKEIFNLNQVDRKPRVLRAVTPAYPFEAQKKGIEGKVILRFVVDENGQVQNPEVIKAEPAGVFEEAAIAAILKYRFDPAVIDNKKVKCFAILPIGFRIN